MEKVDVDDFAQGLKEASKWDIHQRRVISWDEQVLLAKAVLDRGRRIKELEVKLAAYESPNGVPHKCEECLANSGKAQATYVKELEVQLLDTQNRLLDTQNKNYHLHCEIENLCCTCKAGKSCDTLRNRVAELEAERENIMQTLYPRCTCKYCDPNGADALLARIDSINEDNI